MMILRNNKKRIFARSLFYKVLFFFTRPNNLVLCEHFSHKNILLLVSVIFTQKKEKNLFFIPNVEKKRSSLNSKKLDLLYRIHYTIY